MRNFLLFSISVFVSFRCCDSELAVANRFQPWVNDPGYSLYPSLPIAAPQSRNDICKFHSQMLLEHLKNQTTWAVQMWDSSAKAPVGVLSGNIFHLGNFDECLRIAAPFQVKFCVVQVFAIIPSKYSSVRLRGGVSWKSNAWTNIARAHYDPSKVPRDVLNWGLCVPAACESSELEEALNSHLATVGDDSHNETTFRVSLDEGFCTRSDEEKKLSPGEIAFCAFSFILILLVVSSTILDCVPTGLEEKKSKLYRLCMLFSAKQNYKHIFPVKGKTDNPLNVLHGIKFLSILPIVFGHRVGVSLALAASNYNEIEDNFINDHKMFFVQSDLVVDTFFFISGLLASTTLANIYSEGFVNPILAIFIRIQRLSLLYFFIMWYQGTIAFRLGSGPLWNALARNETDYCVTNWWTNALFVNNYVKSEEMCMPHSWFLPCEIHFFTLAVILVPIIVKYPRFGKILLGFVLIVSAVIPALVIFMTKTSPLILFYYEKTPHYHLNQFPVYNVKEMIRTTPVILQIDWTLSTFTVFRTLAGTKDPAKLRVLCTWMLTMSIPHATNFVLHINQPLLDDYCHSMDFFARPRGNESFNLLYIRSHNRSTVYLIGTAVGLFLHYKKEYKKKLSVKTTLIGCLFWLAFLFAPMAYGSLYYDLDREFNVIESAIFGSLRRISWGIGFAIFILCHRFGTIPLIDTVLSSRVAIFLSRITYGIYLIHFNFITSEVLTSRSSKRFSINDVVVEGIVDLIKAGFATLILVFIVEIPTKRLLRDFLFAKRVKKFQKPPEVTTNNKETIFTIRL